MQPYRWLPTFWKNLLHPSPGTTQKILAAGFPCSSLYYNPDYNQNCNHCSDLKYNYMFGVIQDQLQSDSIVELNQRPQILFFFFNITRVQLKTMYLTEGTN
jgi:hypothetical protein